MSKDYGYPSFELICRVSSGDELAIREILKFYDGYISKLCLRPFYHSESGKIIMQVDEERNVAVGIITRIIKQNL